MSKKVKPLDKIQTRVAFADVDISETDWVDPILDRIEDEYARGYLSALASMMNDQGVDTRDEEFRERLLEACHWNIWDK